MNLMTVPIAMSKAHITDDACGGAVQPLTKNKLGHFEFSQLEGAEAISLFAKAGGIVLSSQKRPSAIILSIPRQNGLFW